jgi:hypothetical protein
MKNKILSALAAAAALSAAWGGCHYQSGMKAPEVIRKLSGLRMALALYALEHKTPPISFEETLREGKLETSPGLKLPRHFGSAAVRNAASFKIKDTGIWSYVNNPEDPDFGLLFIDCSHLDEKGRYWSEF